MSTLRLTFLEEPWRIERRMSSLLIVSSSSNRLICTLTAGVQNWLEIAEEVVRSHNASLDGEFEKLENELSVVCEQVSKVYCHITEGRLSKANYLAEVVIAVADDLVTEQMREETERANRAEDENATLRAELKELKESK